MTQASRVDSEKFGVDAIQPNNPYCLRILYPSNILFGPAWSLVSTRIRTCPDAKSHGDFGAPADPPDTLQLFASSKLSLSAHHHDALELHNNTASIAA